MSEEKVLTKEIAEQYLGNSEIDLSDYTTIDDDAAELFAKSDIEIDLSGLTELIDDSTVDSLSKLSCNPLEMSDPQRVSFKALQKLELYPDYNCQIIFQNPKGLIRAGGPFDGTIAETLLPYAEKLSSAIDFEGLNIEVLTLQKAEDLAQKAEKTPWGLEIRDHHHRLITDEAASYLADQDIRSLDLSGIVYLSEESADLLAGFKGERKSSSKLPKVLSLNGLVEISPAIARRLAKFDGDLILGRIYNLDLETANEISNFNALELHLPGMGPNYTDLGELGEFDCLLEFVGADEEKKGVEIDQDVINAVYKFKGKLHAGF